MAPNKPTTNAFARKMIMICRERNPMARKMPISPLRWRTFPYVSKAIQTEQRIGMGSPKMPSGIKGQRTDIVISKTIAAVYRLPTAVVMCNAR